MVMIYGVPILPVGLVLPVSVIRSRSVYLFIIYFFCIKIYSCFVLSSTKFHQQNLQLLATTRHEILWNIIISVQECKLYNYTIYAFRELSIFVKTLLLVVTMSAVGSVFHHLN